MRARVRTHTSHTSDHAPHKHCTHCTRPAVLEKNNTQGLADPRSPILDPRTCLVRVCSRRLPRHSSTSQILDSILHLRPRFSILASGASVRLVSACFFPWSTPPHNKPNTRSKCPTKRTPTTLRVCLAFIPETRPTEATIGRGCLPCHREPEGRERGLSSLQPNGEPGRHPEGSRESRHASVSGGMVMRWTTPQHPCCNPARLVLPAAYVDHVERGPRAASSIRNAREDLPPAGQPWTGLPTCARQSLPILHPWCCADRRGCGRSSCQAVEPRRPAPSSCLRFPQAARASSTLDFSLGCPPARPVF